MKILISLFILLFSFIHTELFAASFNCSKAKQDIELSICSNEELNIIDTELGEVYWAVMKSLTNKQKIKLKKLQREWIRKRDELCAAYEINCLLKAYKNRILELKRYSQQNTTSTKYEITDQTLRKIESQIIENTGYSINISYAKKLYQEFTDPKRKLKQYEKKGGMINFGEDFSHLTIGEQIIKIADMSKDKCNDSRYCEEASHNFYYAVLTTNLLVSAKKLPEKERYKALTIGLFMSALYRENEHNKTLSFYPMVSKMIDAAISDLKNTKLHNPTADFIASLSNEEQIGLLIGSVVLGVAAMINVARYICKDGGCGTSNSFPPIKQADLPKKGYKIINKTEMIIPDYCVYRVQCNNGNLVSVNDHKKGKRPYCPGEIIGTLMTGCFSTFKEAALATCSH